MLQACAEMDEQGMEQVVGGCRGEQGAEEDTVCGSGKVHWEGSDPRAGSVEELCIGIQGSISGDESSSAEAAGMFAEVGFGSVARHGCGDG